MSGLTSAESSASKPRPVIVVTGANGGVGFGICQRLLVQLSDPIPPDTLPDHPSKRGPGAEPAPPSPFAAPDGMTLVLACRNAIKAHRARVELQALLDDLAALPDEEDYASSQPAGILDYMSSSNGSSSSVSRSSSSTSSTSLRKSVSKGGQEEEKDAHGVQRGADLDRREAKARGEYRRRFCAGTKIEFVPLDLGSMASALKCANEITERYKYVTHIILNAGVGPFTALDWPAALYLCFTNFHRFVTYPAYKKQRKGDISQDGYGWVWQSNVGAHYILVRALLPAFRATPYKEPSRIIWTGSIEGFRIFYDEDDFQCVEPPHEVLPYESTKYQCELAAVGLDEVLRRSRLRSMPGTPYEVDGGATSTAGADGKLAGLSAIAEPASSTGRDALRSEQGVEPRSYLSHPGVVASSIAAAVFTFAILETFMKWAFYIARWTLSPHHNITAYKGAVSSVHVALAPAQLLDPSRKYGSRCDWRGREYCHPDTIDGWVGNKFDDAPPHVLPEPIAREQRDGTWDGQPDGARVMVLARAYLRRLEGVAAKVWAEATEESLPPWPALKDMEISSVPGLVGASLLPKSRTGSRASAAGRLGAQHEQVAEESAVEAALGNGNAKGGHAPALVA